ncbi:MAG: alpha/beta hydrolase [Pseudomonadales bacterium]
MIWIVAIVIVLLVFWAVARFHLEGPDLSRFDQPVFAPMNEAPSAQNAQTVARVKEMVAAAGEHKGREQLTFMREAMEAMGAEADITGVEIAPVTVAGRPAEWVTPASGEITGRLLYLHGGAFSMGSPRSHRVITAELARRTGLALLVLEYRLLPEHRRPDGIEDVRAAYRWLLQHGPQGPGTDQPLFVAGDSAGGNLALMLIAWVRDELRAGATDLRQLDGAIALSPLTDATFASPSTRHNVDQDPMLGRMAKMINRMPRSLLLWSAWLRARIPPADPQLSPVYGDLSALPPVLIQASEAEILIDDARRYANKARAAGSPVELQTWHGMVHVWQAFGRDLPETEQAFNLMDDFIKRVITIHNQPDVISLRRGQ